LRRKRSKGTEDGFAALGNKENPHCFATAGFVRNPELFDMLSWSLAFLILALVAGFFGFFGIAGAAASIAKILFFIFLALLVISFAARALRGDSVS
jgi:uncharacterized membrane protein YtjA (UPF0391 family)